MHVSVCMYVQMPHVYCATYVDTKTRNSCQIKRHTKVNFKQSPSSGSSNIFLKIHIDIFCTGNFRTLATQIAVDETQRSMAVGATNGLCMKLGS